MICPSKEFGADTLFPCCSFRLILQGPIRFVHFVLFVLLRFSPDFPPLSQYPEALLGFSLNALCCFLSLGTSLELSLEPSSLSATSRRPTSSSTSTPPSSRVFEDRLARRRCTWVSALSKKTQLVCQAHTLTRFLLFQQGRVFAS